MSPVRDLKMFVPLGRQNENAASRLDYRGPCCVKREREYNKCSCIPFHVPESCTHSLPVHPAEFLICPTCTSTFPVVTMHSS